MNHRLEWKPGWQLVGDRQGWLNIRLFDIMLTGKCEQVLLFFFKKTKNKFFVLCVRMFASCTSLHHTNALCLQRPEEGMSFPRTRDGFELINSCWEPNLDHLDLNC